MESFVLTGKAKTVFRLIELAAQKERAWNAMKGALSFRACPHNPEASCNAPGEVCEYCRARRKYQPDPRD